MTDHVVIVGGGFGGLYAAKTLARTDIQVTLIDRRNFHLFQPLLYQVATGGLSPGDISSPLRAVLARYKNIRVINEEVINIEPEKKLIFLGNGQITYDSLIIATGMNNFYFGHAKWENTAPGLKSIEDALEMRRRIFKAFEEAEVTSDEDIVSALQTFVVVGGGPTGVELAGALGELAHKTLINDFRNIDPAATRVILLEGSERILPTYPEKSSRQAVMDLKKLGVEIITGAMVEDMDDNLVYYKQNNESKNIKTRTVLWAAGVKPTEMAQILQKQCAANLDKNNRVIVEKDLSLDKFPDIFVIGDLAAYLHQGDDALPGVSPVAMQEGRYVARLIRARLKGRLIKQFRYFDKGSLAVIGRHSAVANFHKFTVHGFFAWLIWIFVHIRYLIEFDNKLMVMIQWAWNYFTRKRGARLITNVNNIREAATPLMKKTG